jgi:hypothetical protein
MTGIGLSRDVASVWEVSRRLAPVSRAGMKDAGPAAQDW